MQIAISNVPNDTYLFAGWMNGKVAAPRATFFESDLADIHVKVLSGVPDVAKISFAMLPVVEGNYELLEVGSTIVDTAAPTVVAKKSYRTEDFSKLRIAVPGFNTTAHLLLRAYLPNFRREIFCRANEAPRLLDQDKVDCALLIHSVSSQLTDDYPLNISLLDRWQKQGSDLLPLGCIVARRSLARQLRASIEEALRDSLRYARSEFAEVSSYCVDTRSFCRPRSYFEAAVANWVNSETSSISPQARSAIAKLVAIAKLQGLGPCNLASNAVDADMPTLSPQIDLDIKMPTANAHHLDQLAGE